MSDFGSASEAGRVHSPRLAARRITFTLIAVLIVGVLGTAITVYAQGYRMWVVHTGSMEPTYMPGDVVVDAPPTGHYRPGEVLTFLHSDLASDVVTHRVTDVTPTGLIHTKGDANATGDVWDIRPDQVQGRVISKIKGLGYVLVFLHEPAGLGAVVALVSAIVLLYQLFFLGESETTEDTENEDDEAAADCDADEIDALVHV